MRKFYCILTINLLLTTFCQGQIDPLTLVKKVFDKDTFPDLENHITKEYKGHPNGTDLPKNATTDFLLLGENEKTAVVNLTIIDSAGVEFDTYVHLIKEENIWKIEAFRALAMTGIIAQVKDELEKMTEAQVDSLIEKSKKDTTAFAMFKSKEDYQFELGNARLTLASDDDIIEHFKTNEIEFNRIKDSIQKEIEEIKIEEERTQSIGANYQNEYRTLLISSISTGGYELGNCIDFRIGGMIDNAVGYFYVNDKKDVPDMNPSRIIMVREIGNGWYIYKTT